MVNPNAPFANFVKVRTLLSNPVIPADQRFPLLPNIELPLNLLYENVVIPLPHPMAPHLFDMNRFITDTYNYIEEFYLHFAA